MKKSDQSVKVCFVIPHIAARRLVVRAKQLESQGVENAIRAALLELVEHLPPPQRRQSSCRNYKLPTGAAKMAQRKNDQKIRDQIITELIMKYLPPPPHQLALKRSSK